MYLLMDYLEYGMDEKYTEDFNQIVNPIFFCFDSYLRMPESYMMNAMAHHYVNNYQKNI